MNYLECLNNITDFEKTKEILLKKNLIIKENENNNLFLVKYNKEKCDMNDSDVMKCRGLVLEKNTNKRVCVPPPHSVNVNEFNKIELKDTIYEEFVDGTMINIFKYNDELFISTRSCIGAFCKFYSRKTFNMLFNETIDINKFNIIDNNLNLTVILQHPENVIVTKYETPSIKLVYGVFINNDNNSLTYPDIVELQQSLKEKGLELEIPYRLEFSHVNYIYETLSEMNHNHQGIILKNKDKNVYMRSKIRNEKYNYVRNLKGNSINKKFLYLQLRQNRNLDEYLKYFSEDENVFEIYRLELYDTTNKLFNFYQDYYVRRNENKERLINFKDIDFEYRPLCIELHNNYKQTKKITDKKQTINYINKLPIAKLLFVINYKYRTQTK